MHANAKHPPSTMPKKKGDRDQSFSDDHSTQQPSIHTYLKRSPMNSSSSSSNGNSSTATIASQQQHHNQINDANQTHANSSSKNHHQQQKVNHASENGTSHAATHHSSHHQHHRSTSNKATTTSSSAAATTNNTNQTNGNHNTTSSPSSSSSTATAPSNRLCILCKNVAEGKGYAASSFVEQYKQLYPTYDGSPGIVCTQCYKKCYSYRKRLEKSEEKRKKLEQQLSLSTTTPPTTTSSSSSSSNGSSSSSSSSSKQSSSSSSKKKSSSAVNDNSSSSSSSNNNTTMNPVLIKKRPSSNSTSSATTTTSTNKNRPKHSPVNPKTTTTTAATIRTPIRIVLGSKRVLESPVSSQDSIHSNATMDHEDYNSNELIAYVRNEHFDDDDEEDDEEGNEEVERDEGEDDDSEEEHVAVEVVPLVSESRSKKDHSHHHSNSVKATNAETFDNSVCACCSGNLAGSKYLFVTLERFYKQLFPDARGNNQSRVCNKCYRKCGRHRKASEALLLSSQEEASSTDSSVHSPPTKKQKIEDRTVSPAPQVNQVSNHESAMVSSPPEHVSNHLQAPPLVPQQVSITALPSNFAHMNNLMVAHHTTMGHYQQQVPVAFVPAPHPVHPPNTTIFLEIQSPNAQPKTIRTKIYAKAPLNEVSAIVQKHVDSLLGDSFVVDHIERLSTDCSGTTIVETIYEDDYFEEFPAIERERFIIRTKRRV